MTYDMEERLEEERKRRCLQSVPETILAIVSQYLATHPLDESTLQRREENEAKESDSAMSDIRQQGEKYLADSVAGLDLVKSFVEIAKDR